MSTFGQLNAMPDRFPFLAGFQHQNVAGVAFQCVTNAHGKALIKVGFESYVGTIHGTFDGSDLKEVMSALVSMRPARLERATFWVVDLFRTTCGHNLNNRCAQTLVKTSDLTTGSCFRLLRYYMIDNSRTIFPPRRLCT